MLAASPASAGVVGSLAAAAVVAARLGHRFAAADERAGPRLVVERRPAVEAAVALLAVPRLALLGPEVDRVLALARLRQTEPVRGVKKQ